MKRYFRALFAVTLFGFMVGLTDGSLDLFSSEASAAFPACDNKCRERYKHIDCSNSTNCWSSWFRSCLHCEFPGHGCVDDGFAWGHCQVNTNQLNRIRYHSSCSAACDCTNLSISEATTTNQAGRNDITFTWYLCY